MKRLTIYLICLLTLILKVSGQNIDSLYRHETSIYLDTVLDSSRKNFDKTKSHWISFSFLNMPSETEFKAERNYQVFRKGVKIYEETLPEEIFLKLNGMSFRLYSCILLPNDSIIITLNYRLFNPWVDKWSSIFNTKKVFQINSITNYEFNDYFIEIRAFNNKEIISPDKISLTSYSKGIEYNPFIYIKDNRFFYETIGDSLKVVATVGDLKFENIFHIVPKYGGFILCGKVDKKLLYKEIREANKEKEMYGENYFRLIDEPYLLLNADKLTQSTKYIIIHDKCSDSFFTTGLIQYDNGEK